MKQHRSTHLKVSKQPENRSFETGTALEHLRAERIDVEALARAAEAAADALPAPSTDRQRMGFGRIQSLTTKASQQASASLPFANAQVTALAAQMQSTAERRRLAEQRRVAAPAVQAKSRGRTCRHVAQHPTAFAAPVGDPASTPTRRVEPSA